MFEILFRPAVTAPLVLLTCYIIYNCFFKSSKLQDIPIAGTREGDWFPYWQAKWRNTLDSKNALNSAYRQFKDQPYRLPVAGGMGETVVLPKKWTSFVASQPDDVLSLYKQAAEFFQLDHTFLDNKFHSPPVHVDLIARDLTKQIGNLVTEMEEETRLALNKEWAMPDAWTDVRVYDTVQTMLGMVTARVAYGKTLSREPGLFKLSMECVQRSFVCGVALHYTWTLFRPVLAPLLMIPVKITNRKFRKIVAPEIRRRLADWDCRHTDIENQKDVSGSEPNDYLQWAIRHAKELGDPYLWREDVLASRLLILNFVSIHTSTFTLTHVILDLASCDQGVVEELREEITSVLAEHGGEWSKKALNKMEKLDSTLRESARLNSLVTIGSNRLIISPQGLTLPNGQTLPMGVNIMLQAYPVLHDDVVYPDAGTFRPFRFAQARRDESVDYVQRARNSFATTSADFLAFGHGRHACPGRFFAAAELKLMLAHILLDYDIETRQRPRNKWYGVSRTPDMEATVRIRRRKK
ncbi:uncharacterized protein PpBr36_09510 [Pyricularia pennisetigena]|uniref:uncharacterized protein n=1 Tax=Pyricularia pennisetigena TaxID=1578925 RepID=UPI00114D7441|nr:uncharacterized protein PpBr36_09510 [Pyricularia pennisetigena]TLS22089.1 hypothetical protein PpBr36_09510 [Pyricularia pennisetigena]